MVCLISVGWTESNRVILNEPVDLRKELIAIATSQLGIIEATGRNDGKGVYKYQKNIGLKAGTGWCGAFATWCFDSLQKVYPVKIEYPRTGVANNWFKSNVIYVKNKTKELKIKPGMVAGEGLNSITHVAIVVEKWDNFHYVTIAGNETNQVKHSVKETKYLIKMADYLKKFDNE